MSVNRPLKYIKRILINDPDEYCTTILVGSEDRYLTPTTCFEARDLTERDDIKTAILYAEGMASLSHKKHPYRNFITREAFLPFDEPLYPIPIGPSIYYFVMTAWMTIFYLTCLFKLIMRKVEKKLDLHPEASRFPNIPLYWIQQSRREVEVRREVRNTWAWLARRYLLSPDDPLLTNVDQILGYINWQDFELSRSTWSVIKMILKKQAMYVKVRNRKGMRDFTLIRESDLSKNNRPVPGDPVYESRVIDDPYHFTRQKLLSVVASAAASETETETETETNETNETESDGATRSSSHTTESAHHETKSDAIPDPRTEYKRELAKRKKIKREHHKGKRRKRNKKAKDVKKEKTQVEETKEETPIMVAEEEKHETDETPKET